MLLSRFARVSLSHAPTPLEPLDRLRAAIGGPRLWIKRDDCTGLAQGGNKARKLEFLVADALAQGCDTLITPGAVQSNHVRMTAAAAARFGLKAHAVLERRVPATDADYEENGNVLLDELFGCPRTYVPSGADVAAACADVAKDLAAKGAKPYIIPGGGSNHVGALGYVACAIELVEQAKANGIAISRVVHGTGSSGTQAGLVVGFAALRSPVEVFGISVRQPRKKQEEVVFDLACRTAEHLGHAGSVERGRVFADDGGKDLVGTSLFGCHPEPALAKLKDLLRTGSTNIYTIEKNGVRKLIYQAPWTHESVVGGMIEISIELPADMQHFIRT